VSIENDDVERGKCNVTFSRDWLSTAERNAFAQYGPQLVSITVHRDGSETDKDGSAQWTIRNASDSVGLPAPKTGTDGDAFYHVQIQTVTDSPRHPYRSGAAPADELGRTAGQRFEAVLRPRGPFSWWPLPVRTFFTIPLNVTSMRFPASPIDLRSSSSRSQYQVLTLDAGVLFAIEPWNYSRAKNLFPVPIRLLTGFNIVNLSAGSLDPSFVVGGSLTAPLVDSGSQFGTSLALGGFYEIDLREQSPWAHGRHFLLTFGINLFSLAGAKGS
jgi:hypothetical protein